MLLQMPGIREVIREGWIEAQSYFDAVMWEQLLRKCKRAALLCWCQAPLLALKHSM